MLKDIQVTGKKDTRSGFKAMALWKQQEKSKHHCAHCRLSGIIEATAIH